MLLNKNEIEELKIYKNIYYYNTFNDHIIYRFKIIKELGVGSFSKVLKVYDYKNKRFNAIKIIKNNIFSTMNEMNEIEILSGLKQKEQNNITKLFEYFYFRNNLCLVMKLYGITLHEYIYKNNKNNNQNDNQNYIYLKQILNAINYLNKNNIIHRDIKPNNIVFKDNTCKNIILIDFGNAINIENIDLSNDTNIQTISYRAPEIILNSISSNKIIYNYKIDIWSIGCIAFELFYKKRLFNSTKILDLFINQNIIFDPPSFKYLTQFKEIHKLYDDIENPSYIKYNSVIYAFKKNKFIEKYKENKILLDFILKCCEWDSNYRIDCNGASLFLTKIINN